MLIEQLINLEKVRTENLKFGKDLRDRVMDGWSLVSNTVDKSKCSKKLQSSLHAFKHRISFATNLATKL